MSDQRLQELGIPRRRFLKRTAAATFVAPAVVSFAFDGAAEAGTQSFSNQSFCNQIFSNQSFSWCQPCQDMFGCIALALAGGQCSYTTAQTLQQTVVSITLGIANGLGSGICQTLAQLGNTVKSANLPLAVKNQLLQDIAILETALGCACTV